MSLPQTYQPDPRPSSQVPEPLVYPASPPRGSGTTLGTIVLAGLGCITVLAGVYYFTKRAVLNKAALKAEDKSFTEGTPQTIAKEIKMAFENDGWWGTDTQRLREALMSLKSQEQWESVKTEYEKLYSTVKTKASLIRDMSDELQSTEYKEMMQIVNSKPAKTGQSVPHLAQWRAWAKRFKAAFDKTYGFLPGTDSDAIDALLNEIPTQQEYINTAVTYKQTYNQNLNDDLKGEAEFGQYTEWIKKINAKPKK